MSYQQSEKIEYGYRAKTLKSYLIGWVGSLLLTLSAFALMYANGWDDATIYIVISVLAILQLILQSICFLRLNATPAGCWNLFPFLFVLMIIAFLVGGSFWIMYNLNGNMV